MSAVRVVDLAGRLCASSRFRDRGTSLWVTAWVLDRLGWSLARIACELHLETGMVTTGIVRIRQVPKLLAIATAVASFVSQFPDIPNGAEVATSVPSLPPTEPRRG